MGIPKSEILCCTEPAELYGISPISKMRSGQHQSDIHLVSQLPSSISHPLQASQLTLLRHRHHKLHTMLSETRPSYARVLQVTAGEKAHVPEDGVFDEKVVTAPALKRAWLERNLSEMAVGKELMGVFPDVRSAVSSRQAGYCVAKFIELVYGGGPEVEPWEKCAHHLDALGFMTGTKKIGKTTLDIVLSCRSTRKRKSVELSSVDFG